MLFCPGGHAFAHKFLPGARLLTTSKKIQKGGAQGGAESWHLELTDALCGEYMTNINQQCFVTLKEVEQLVDLIFLENESLCGEYIANINQQCLVVQ